jgi:hypothetical protein
MTILIRLFITGIALFFYLSMFLPNIDDRSNAIPYKIYMFLFVFIVQFIMYFVTNSSGANKNSINQIIESAINNALLAVIAFDVYGDLYANNIFKDMNQHQRIISLVLLIVGFMTTVKIIQLLITNN